MTNPDFQTAYADHVAELERRLSADEAFRNAVGGDFVAVGKLEYYLLRSLGLTDDQLVVDVGCGSGRLACQLAPFPGIRYIGCDVVQSLLSYALDLCHRPDWSFMLTNGRTIPCPDGSADFICFFSVFTHLLHEDSYRYLREARRCLKAGGLVVISFLEFRIPNHWPTFIASVEESRPGQHLNQFLEREAILAWAHHAGLEVTSIRSGDRHHIPIPEVIEFDRGARMGNLGNWIESIPLPFFQACRPPTCTESCGTLCS
jgi:SAM-dependent methyltransferase